MPKLNTHQFLLSIKEVHTKENWFFFSASGCTTITATATAAATTSATTTKYIYSGSCASKAEATETDFPLKKPM